MLCSTKQTQLFCGKGANGIFVGPDNPAATVGKVFVDTRNSCSTTVSIEFSSIVSFLATDDGLTPDDFGAEGRLNFALFRVCNGKSPELLKNWGYEVARIEDAFEGTRFIDTFSFNFCDVLPCPSCCEYFVEVSVETLITANIKVNNVHITALA